VEFPAAAPNFALIPPADARNRSVAPTYSTHQWLLFKYVSGVLTPLSKPFKSKQAAARARAKLSPKDQPSTAIGIIRSKQ
jgi:hypothetical protein